MDYLWPSRLPMNYYKENENNYLAPARKDLICLVPPKSGLRAPEPRSHCTGNLMNLEVNGIASKLMGIELFRLPDIFQIDLAVDQSQKIT